MDPKFVKYLYYGSIILVGVAVVLAILSETGIYHAVPGRDMMSLVYTSAVLLFIAWQFRRNARR